jgi:hypothetical protein
VQFKNAQVAAYKITLGAGCTGATVFSHADGTQFPIVTALPSFPGDTGCGNTDVDTKNQKAVPPGAYRDLIVRANQGIALASGVYFFCNVSVAKGGSLSVDDGTTVYVRSTMNVGNDAWVTAGTDDGAVRVQWYVEGWLVPEKDSSVSFARGAHFRGWLYAKDQKVALGHASDIEGHVWAGSMVSDWNVTVEPPPGPPPTTVPQTSGPPTTVPPTTVPQTTAPTTVPDTVPL